MAVEYYRRGEKMLRVLEILDKGSVVIADLLDSFLTPGFGYKGKKSLEQRRALGRRRWERRRAFSTRLLEDRERQRLHSLLYYLEREGFIVKKQCSGARGSLFRLTAQGKDKKKIMTAGQWRGDTSCEYEPQPSDTITIIIFDIPERDRYKRAWLRSALKNMGFTMVQRSVWAARLMLPKEFIKDLQKINILQYVLISSLAQEGMIGGLVE